MSLGCLGCQRAEPITPTGESFSVVVERMAFEDTYLGASRVKRLRIHNTARPSLRFRIEVTEPYSTAESTFDVPGATTGTLNVTFAPVAVGDVEGSLVLTTESGRRTEVGLIGAGLAPLTCPASTACVDTRFNPELGTCVSTDLADGTTCTVPCLDDGICRAGQCVGRVTAACDDFNACTTDACGSDGACVHVPRTCPVSDPCLAAACDADAGCLTVPVADGTLCGTAPSCAVANVCINGTCVSRNTPNFQDECSAVAVATRGGAACTVNRSGRARCWGQGYSDDDSPPLMTSLVVPDATSVAMTQESVPVCISSSTEMRCLDSSFTLPPGRLEFSEQWFYDSHGGIDAGFLLCSVNGASAACVERDIGQFTISGPAGTTLRTGLASSCAFGDGGIWCAPARGAFAPVSLGGAVRDVATSTESPSQSGIQPRVLALRDDGTVWHFSDPHITPPGLVPSMNVEAIENGVVITGTSNQRPGWQHTAWGFSYYELGATLRLSAVATDRERSLVCAVYDDGGVVCAGANEARGLGQPGHGPSVDKVHFSERPWALASLSRNHTFVRVDGGLADLGVIVQDAGVTWAVPEPVLLGEPDLVEAHLTAAGDLVTLRSNGELWNHANWNRSNQQPTLLSTDAFRVTLPHASREVCYATAGQSGTVWCAQTPNQPPRDMSTDVDGGTWPSFITNPFDLKRLVAHSWPQSLVCGLATDGDLWCNVDQTLNAQLGPLVEMCPPVISVNFGDATVLTSAGDVWEWNVAANTLRQVAALSTPVRQLACSSDGERCAVSGPNDVRCWSAGSTPTRVPMIEQVEFVAIDSAHVCAQGTSGRLMCRGRNERGQLGLTSLVASEVLLPVP